MSGRRDELMGLAATPLARYRDTRYRGEEVAIALSSFDPLDRAAVIDLYAWLTGLERALAPDDARRSPEALQRYVEGHPAEAIVASIQALGRRTDDRGLARVVHDVRGGALNPLLLQLASLLEGPFDPSWVTSVAFLARDHRKVMRGLVHDLDGPGRERDLATIPHGLGTLVQALKDLPLRRGGHCLDVDVDVSLDGSLEPTIAESCVECGAIDRIVYNFLNNAARHADPPRVSASFLRAGDDLRVVVENPVRTEERAGLAKAIAGGDGLFGGFSSTGSGHGLQVVAYLVGSAYGIADPGELVQGGYIGTQLRDHRFLAWFHWPLAGA